MTDKQKIEALRQAYDEIVWMAIRYADGRQTYAPSMVRDSVKSFQRVFPDWKPTEDRVITKPKEDSENVLMGLRSDYLYDLVNPDNK